MNKKNKQNTIIIVLISIIVIILIFLIVSLFTIRKNIHQITWDDIIDITPKEKTFDFETFQNSLLKNIETNQDSIAAIYAQKNIEIIDDSVNEQESKKQETKIETIKTLQWNGIIISPDGYIISNQHVLEDINANYTVKINDQEFEVSKIWYDEWLDLAIIKINVKEELIPATIKQIDQTIKIWQTVFALKYDPENQETIIKMGIINSKNQKFKIDDNRTYVWFLQTSTAIEPGFSWGPLLDIYGEVIWINTAIDNIEYWASYSLPINQEFVNQTISSIKESGKIIRPYIGIKYEMNSLWLLITEVEENSPAQDAWLQIWDIIYGINDIPTNYNNFLYQLYTYKVDKEIVLNIKRGNFNEDLQIKLWIKENSQKTD